MGSVELDLGSLELESKFYGLQLQLFSVARFAPSAEDDVDTLREQLTHENLNASRRVRPWITRGNAFRLELSLQMEVDPDLGQDETLIETLTSRLRTAKLWQQLSLIPSSVEAKISFTHRYIVTVYLAHEQGEPGRSKRVMHKLADAPFHDVRPPLGICSAALDCVKLDMHIRTVERQPQTQPKRRRTKPNVQECFPVDSLVTASASESDMMVMAAAYKVNLPDFLSFRAMSAPSAPGSLLEFDDDDNSNWDTSMLLRADDEDTRRQHHEVLTAPALLKRSSSALDLEVTKAASCNNAILDLLDSGVRMAICDARRHFPKGISLTKTESLKHLADLVPPLWSPGYLPAIASRAIFLPTISHALGTICHQDAKSQALKAERRASAMRHSRILSSPQEQPSPRCTTNILSSALWQTLQSNTYDPAAAKRLRSILIVEDQSPIASQPRNEVLDIVRGDLCSCPFDDSDVEDDDDLFGYDGGFKSEVDDDLFCVDPNKSSRASQYEASDSRASVNTSSVDFAEVFGVQTGCGPMAIEDDLLSICESLKSLPLTENCCDDFEAWEISEGYLNGGEMLCI